MKTYHFSRYGLLAGALLMAFTLLSSAYAESVTAKVESLKGSAFYDNGNGAVALAVGAEISAGSVVTTSPDSEVVLRIASSILRIFGSTTVSLDRLNEEATTAGQGAGARSGRGRREGSCHERKKEPGQKEEAQENH